MSMITKTIETKSKVIFKDSKTIQEALDKMTVYSERLQQAQRQNLPKLIYEPDKKVMQAFNIVMPLLAAFGYRPNNNQQAAVRYIQYALAKYSKKRVFMEVASGLGKSYIIILTVAVLLQLGQINSVMIVYSEPEIRDQEEKNVDMLKTILNGDARVTTRVHQTFSDFNFTFQKQLTIIDEADRLLFGDDRDEVPKLTGDSPILCLSATGLAHASEDEKNHLSKICKMTCISTQWADIELESHEIQEVHSFRDFLNRTQKQGKIVYANDDQLEELKAEAQQKVLTVFVNNEDVDQLRRLAPNQCCFVSQDRLMRGFDYRSLYSADDASQET